MFSQVSVCPQGGVCHTACWDTPPRDQRQTPPGSRHPPGPDTHATPLGPEVDTPLGRRHPPRPDTPQTRHPWSRHPRHPPGTRGRHPLGTRHPPRHPPRSDTPGADTHATPLGPEADTPWDQTLPRADTPRSGCWEIWATSGRYASYWNAYLLPCTGWPRHRENREFGSYFFQTGKTQGILF